MLRTLLYPRAVKRCSNIIEARFSFSTQPSPKLSGLKQLKVTVSWCYLSNVGQQGVSALWMAQRPRLREALLEHVFYIITTAVRRGTCDSRADPWSSLQKWHRHLDSYFVGQRQSMTTLNFWGGGEVQSFRGLKGKAKYLWISLMTTIAPYTLIFKAGMLRLFLQGRIQFSEILNRGWLKKFFASWRIEFDWSGKFVLCLIWSHGTYLNTDFY